MKLVVVDVGNTSTAVGLWSGGRVTRVSHIDGGGSAALLAAESLLGRRPDGGSPCGRAALAYASVVPKADAAWRRFA